MFLRFRVFFSHSFVLRFASCTWRHISSQRCSRGALLRFRWRPPGGTADAAGKNDDDDDSARQGQQGGRLRDACCRLLAALVLTTAMHPGTLMADLGAGPLQDGPTVRRRLTSFDLVWFDLIPSSQRLLETETVKRDPRRGSRLYRSSERACFFVLFSCFSFEDSKPSAYCCLFI